MLVDCVQSGKGLNWTNQLSQRELILPDCLAGTSGLLPPLDSKLKHWLFLSLKPASFGTTTYTVSFPGSLGSDWNKTISSPGSLACWLQSLGLFSLCNHMSQFLILNVFIYKHTHTHTTYWFCFLWRLLAHTALDQNFKLTSFLNSIPH